MPIDTFYCEVCTTRGCKIGNRRGEHRRGVAAAGWDTAQAHGQLHLRDGHLFTVHILHSEHTAECAQGVSPLMSISKSAQPTDSISPEQAVPNTLCCAAFVATPLLHAGALFSNSFVLAEGRMLGFGMASLTLLLGRSALLPPPSSHQQRQRQRHRPCNPDPKPPAQQGATTPYAVRASAPEGKCCGTISDGKPARSPGDEGYTAKALLDDVNGDHGLVVPPLAAADASDWQRTARVAATGAAALMLLWALGQRGLVVRSGHDAMWRTAAEHRTVLPFQDFGAQAQAGHTASSLLAGAAAEYLPLTVLPWIMSRAKHSMLAKTW